MSVELNTLYQKVTDYDFNIVAGRSGMKNQVNWFQLLETIQSIDFIEEHSIIFTTGQSVNCDEDLEELVVLQSQSGAAGTILILGERIKSVPKSLINYCNRTSYPLFVINNERDLSKVMRVMSYEILRSEKASIELSAALKDAISFPHKQDLYIPVFMNYGFSVEGKYCMAIVEPYSKGETIEAGKIVKMVKLTEKILMSYGTKSFIINCDNTFQILFSDYSEEKIHLIVSKILSALKKIHQAGFYVSIGANLPGIHQISLSYQYAYRVQHMIKKRDERNTVYEFDQLGIYKVILSINDRELLKNTVSNSLGKLQKYDSENNTNLYEILKIYLENDGSIKAVANILFQHRNSINYKMSKIEEILKVDISSLSVRAELYLAYRIEEVL